jgi:23S rRNA (guanosine2251-2'-O)-methyltransferase
MDELGRMDAGAFRAAPKMPVVVILDQVRSGLNVGSIFRSADAFRVEEIVCCGITPAPPHREVLKTALGATESVRWRYAPSAAEEVMAFRQKGYQTWAVEQAHGSVPLESVVLQYPVALVFGNEVSGVSDEALSACGQCIELTQHGTKHSLNVAVTAGIVLHHLALAYYRSAPVG